MIDIRVGQGFDIHRFAEEPVEGRVLILGGVSFPGERVLVGHSDADVIAHAAA
ncbi:MAG: 2-C-methyl-D-erythritol 2,4-cyclodiphosphate synthase, partial [Acidimicrobiaceae bacterium]